MTKARTAALEVLRGAEEPLSAAAVHGMMGSDCDQATVYRTLHYLEDHGYAESFVLHCTEHGTERYYTAVDGGADGCGSPAHRHWFHCESCHRFIDLGSCTVSELVESFERERGVRVRRHILYFTGLCSDCADTCAPT